MTVYTRSADGLLSYALATSPTDPLNASTDKDPVIGRLNITVGRDVTAAAYCRKITVKIPIGAGAAELTTVNTDDIKQSVTGGTAPDQGNGWTATATAEGNKRVFTFTPGRAPQFTGQWAVTLVISQIPINKVVGKPVIEVIEESSPTNGNFTAKTTTIIVDKAPPGFLFRNLRPSKIMVPNGDPVTLTWEVQNARCTMYWDDQPGADVSKEPRWTSPALHNTTAFMLQAVSAEDASFIHTLTTAVTVDKPDLEIGDLTVYGKARILRRHPPVAMADSSDWRATTDGIVAVTFRRTGPDARNIDLRIRAEGSDHHDLIARFSADVGSGDEEKTLSVPLQQGECMHFLQYYWQDIEATLSWCSFGDGELEFLGIVPW
ncbi:hypothetical protein [Kitasatospora sp. NBC_01266]|uniref:hypothetical protein n=1 Tax=Kitasatospora sp. NBC_01266 TaxID=2903572 RepID=UPI002E2EC45F|nr:hypothetical protein [Kitasatospora sp. NBC_01266]